MKKVLKSLEKMRSYATYDNGMDLTVNTKLRDEFIMTVNNIKKELSKLDEIKKVVEGIYIFKSNDTKIAMISEILEEK